MPNTPKSSKSANGTELSSRLVNLAKKFVDKYQYFKIDADISEEKEKLRQAKVQKMVHILYEKFKLEIL